LGGPSFTRLRGRDLARPASARNLRAATLQKYRNVLDKRFLRCELFRFGIDTFGLPASEARRGPVGLSFHVRSLDKGDAEGGDQ
jgi:hypothetical protein